MIQDETMQDLIERLEKATGPDRDLDGRVWAELDGRDVRIAYCEHWGRDALLAKSRRPPHDECVVGLFGESRFYTVGQSNPPANYTGSIDAALTLVPAGWWLDDLCQFPMEPSTWRAVLSSKGGGYYAALQFTVDSCKATGEDGTTPAIAICIASLRAREALKS